MANEARSPAPQMKGDASYKRAMDETSDLIIRMREAGREHDVARSLTTDIWTQAKNTPFLTTVFEAIQEAKSGPETARDHRLVAFKINGAGVRRG